jgi:hypothetical protein
MKLLKRLPKYLKVAGSDPKGQKTGIGFQIMEFIMK